MKMYLVVTSCGNDARIYKLYSTRQAALEDFHSRIGCYIYESIYDCYDGDSNKISFEEVTDIFSKCSIAQDQTYIVFDDIEFYIEELDVDG